MTTIQNRKPSNRLTVSTVLVLVLLASACSSSSNDDAATTQIPEPTAQTTETTTPEPTPISEPTLSLAELQKEVTAQKQSLCSYAERRYERDIEEIVAEAWQSKWTEVISRQEMINDVTDCSSEVRSERLEFDREQRRQQELERERERAEREARERERQEELARERREQERQTAIPSSWRDAPNADIEFEACISEAIRTSGYRFSRSFFAPFCAEALDCYYKERGNLYPTSRQDFDLLFDCTFDAIGLS